MEKYNASKPPGPKSIVIIRNAYRYDFGGGERMPVDLAQQLSNEGYDLTVISRNPKLMDYASAKGIANARGWWWSRQNWSGPRILLTPVYFAWQIILTIWYVWMFIKLKPSIVHAQSKDDFIAASIAGKLRGAKIIWSDHADLKYIYQNSRVWYKNPIGKLVKFCSRFASTIILTSQNDKQLIGDSLGDRLDSKYIVIYNGIVDRPELLDRAHSDKLVFASTSRLVAAKGIGELIEAFKVLNVKYPSAELWLLGEGPQQKMFEAQAAGQKTIIFKGFPKNYLEQVAKADVFVHPSYMEGFSVSLIEAAMLGKPIVACRVGGNPEIIKDGKNGLLIPSKDSQALAAAMMQLAGDKELRHKLGRQARDTYENNYVFNTIVKEKYRPLYG